MMLDLRGQRFGRLLVLMPTSRRAFRGVVWECLCDCGSIRYVRSQHLRSGNSRSCGCLTKDMHPVKHGLARKNKPPHPLYSTWASMLARCRDSNRPNYKWYGGRGIMVCERWLDFEAFLKDVGPKPAPEFSLDRIDPDGNYEPGNVRWATQAQQVRNRSRRMMDH